MEILMQDNKRKRPKGDNSNDAGDGIAKRHKSAVVTAMAPNQKVKGSSAGRSKSESPPQFQRYHLSILLSLYESDEEEEEDDDPDYYQGGDNSSSHRTSPSNNQGNRSAEKNATSLNVDDNLWKQTKKFLREREKLMRQKHEASRLKDVHQEALNYMAEGELDFHATSPRSVSTERSGRKIPLLAQSSVGHRYNSSVARSVASPAHTLSFFSPQKTLSASEASSTSDSKPPFRCFGLVANLLEKKAHAFESSARYFSNPYGPVLKDIEANISKLESHLKCLQETNVANSKQAVEDMLSRPVLSSFSAPSSSFWWKTPRQERDAGVSRAKSAISKLETKLTLWNMLVTDMKTVAVE